MASRIQCPNCHEPVYVRDAVDASHVKCPACGVDVGDGEFPDDLLSLAREQLVEEAIAETRAAQGDVHWSADPAPKAHHIPANSWLMKCCDCGAAVSKSADRCPYCGGDPKRVLRWQIAGGCLMVGPVVATVIFFLWVVFSR